MRVKIYQINSERDKARVKFNAFDRTQKLDSSIYDEVFDAELYETSLEAIYTRFNTEWHPLFRGHSLSVSDIVVIEPENIPYAVGKISVVYDDGQRNEMTFSDLVEYNATIAELTEQDADFEAHDMLGLKIPMINSGAYYCDTFGFQKVDFDESITHKPDNLMRIIYVEPHRAPYIAEIEHSLKAEQRAVGGLIEPIYNGDGTCLICNDESKLIGMEGNRRIGDSSSIIAGPFFVCGDTGKSFRSLTDEEVVKYMDRFKEPEDISPEEVQADMGIQFIPM